MLWICSDTTPANSTAATSFNGPGVQPTDRPVGDNAHIEAFNSLVRRECLSQHWFTTLEEARGILETWKEEYNNDRPHGSL